MYSNHLLNALAIFGARYVYMIMALMAIIYFLRLPRQTQIKIATFSIVSLPIMFVVLKIAGRIYFDPRPFIANHFTPLIPHDPDNGFPSDHSVLTAAMATMFTPYTKWFRVLLWVLVLVVTASRVYVGIHHTLDVAAGALIAIIVGALVYQFILPKVLESAKYQQFYKRILGRWL